MSEISAEVKLIPVSHSSQDIEPSLPITLEIGQTPLILPGQITQSTAKNGERFLRVLFQPLNLDQQRRLVEFLFCRPGQWQRKQAPGELRSLRLMIRSLIGARIFQMN